MNSTPFKKRSQILAVEANRPADAGRLLLNLDQMAREFGDRAAVDLATDLALFFLGRGVDVAICRDATDPRRREAGA